MSRTAKPPGVELDLRVDDGAPPSVRVVRTLRAVPMGETLSIVSADPRTTGLVADAIRATGNSFLATIPFGGYVRIVVRRKR
jgi:tRNA 2-thiouridine synthesizing protein A